MRLTRDVSSNLFHRNSSLSHSTPALSLSTLSHSVEDRRGTGRQLIMKYDPVICGLCSAEDVTQRRQTQTCSGKLQQMGEDYILYFVPHFPTLLNFPSYDTQRLQLDGMLNAL